MKDRLYFVFPNEIFIFEKTKKMGLEQSRLNNKFFESVKKGDIEEVKSLLEQKAEVNCWNYGERAIIHACNNSDMLKLLIENKAEVNYNYGKSPLYHAYLNENMDCVKICIENGAYMRNGGVYDKEFQHRLVERIVKKKRSDIIKILIDQGYRNWDKIDYDIHRACMSSDVEMVKNLILYGTDVNSTNLYGKTLLYIACENNNIEMARTLLENKADTDKTCDTSTMFYKSTFLYPIMCAAYNNGTEMLRLLIEYKANVATLDSNWNNVLIVCAQNNCMENVKLLLEHTSWPENTLEKILPCSYEIIKFYLENSGIDPNYQYDVEVLTENKNYKPSNSRFGISLLSNTYKTYKEYVLAAAVKKQYYGAVKALLEAKADVNIGDINNRSLLELAGETGNARITSLLLSYGATMEIVSPKYLNDATRLGNMNKVLEFLKKGVVPDAGFLKAATESKNMKLIEIASRIGTGESIEEVLGTSESTLPSAPVEDEQEEGVVSL